ncbi:hypothetical protein PQR39_35415 [Paraburkholderia sediminicola]|uniref:hypothetical protein n=1 Tax=Paraburkholderia sediminicola TaxID=458836 RepID=UPI0038B76E58
MDDFGLKTLTLDKMLADIDVLLCDRMKADPHGTLDKALETARNVRILLAESRPICAARKQGTAGGNAPADCDWPGCGCDESANKVMESLLDGHNLALTFAQRDVLRERAEHVTREHFTPGHDDMHKDGVLANAAAAYALAAGDELTPSRRGAAGFFTQPSRVWPFGTQWWKPKNPRTAMVKAAALLIAEIEKIDRAAGASNGVSNG